MPANPKPVLIKIFLYSQKFRQMFVNEVSDNNKCIKSQWGSRVHHWIRTIWHFAVYFWNILLSVVYKIGLLVTEMIFLHRNDFFLSMYENACHSGWVYDRQMILVVWSQLIMLDVWRYNKSLLCEKNALVHTSQTILSNMAAVAPMAINIKNI